MKSGKIGILSAVIASSCCVIPLLLILAGLGSVGFAAKFAQYDWLFATVGVGLLGVSYWWYFRERKACAAGTCEMRGKKFTQISLGVSTLVIAFVVGLMAFSHFSASPTDAAAQATMPTQQSTGVELATLKVDGMTCVSCAWGVEASLKRVPGVVSAKVDFNAGIAKIQYRPQEATPEKLVQAVSELGYHANPVPSDNQPLKPSAVFSYN